MTFSRLAGWCMTCDAIVTSGLGRRLFAARAARQRLGLVWRRMKKWPTAALSRVATRRLGWLSIAIPVLAVLAGCGEMGSDPKGPFKAYLNLQGQTGQIENFYLGSYDSLESCIELIEFEAKSYERDQGRKFYTNAEFSYGGFKSDSLPVEHLIVGAQCIEES